MIPAAISEYLRRRGVRTWSISGAVGSAYAGAVVIPALAESPRLFQTLNSLALNPPELLDKFLVLVVVNHREDAPAEDKEDNRKTLEMFAAGAGRHQLPNLCWVDAASPGMEIPLKMGGVGLARKIGADLALPRLNYKKSSPLIIYLDADTLVEASYLGAIVDHFQHEQAGGANIPFRHQRPASLPEQLAIDTYELFLRCYVLGLEIAGSPYAFHTVGSAMACKAIDYARMGGMNCRAAGEDFYFLQQLHRVAGVAQLRGTVVHPSPRPSHRVPFGTGRAMSRALAGEAEAISFHSTQCFVVLREWLQLVTGNINGDAATLISGAAAISQDLAAYLNGAGFPAIWVKLQANNKDDISRLNAFHGWFDGLKTMRLIHHLSETAFHCCSADRAIETLFSVAGEEACSGVSNQLKVLQKRQFAK